MELPVDSIYCIATFVIFRFAIVKEYILAKT